MYRKFLFYTLFLCSTFCFSQDNIDWQNALGGEISESLEDIVKTADGYFLAGSTISGMTGDISEPPIAENQSDFWLVRLDNQGEIIWDRIIGTADFDIIGGADYTEDDGFIIIAVNDQTSLSGDLTEITNGSADSWILKLDSQGNIEWQNTIGGTSIDAPISIEQTNDGGYITLMRSASGISGDKTENSQGSFDFWVVKLDDQGVIEWQNTIGGTGSDFLRSINLTQDGGYIINSTSTSGIGGDKTEESRGEQDYWVIKLNASGDIVWDKTLGGDDRDFGQSAVEFSNGTIVVGGFSESDISGDKTEGTNGGRDYWALKLTSEGQLLDQVVIGGDDTDQFAELLEAEDGTTVLAGHSSSSLSGDKDEEQKGYWIVKLTEEALNIETTSAGISLKVYPNPAEEFLSITTPKRILKYQIINNVGQILMTKEFDNTAINIDELSRGIYYIRLYIDGDYQEIKRFIKN